MDVGVVDLGIIADGLPGLPRNARHWPTRKGVGVVVAFRAARRSP